MLVRIVFIVVAKKAMVKDIPNLKNQGKEVSKLNQAILTPKVQQGNVFMHSRVGMSMRALRI